MFTYKLRVAAGHEPTNRKLIQKFMQGERMLDFCRRRLTWPVLLELLVFCEMEDEAEIDDPLKKEDEFTVELIRRGVTFSMGERPMMDE